MVYRFKGKYAGTPKQGTDEDRFWSYVDQSGPVSSWSPTLGPCWIWTGPVRKSDGYGQITIGSAIDGTRRVLKAYAYSLELAGIETPEGMQRDHLCHTRLCVRPTHIEFVTPAENTRRGISGQVNGSRQRSKTHCVRGHPYTGDNLYIYVGKRGPQRFCRQCKRDSERTKYISKRSQQPAPQ